MVTQLAQVYGEDSEYAGAVNVLSTLGCIVIHAAAGGPLSALTVRPPAWYCGADFLP